MFAYFVLSITSDDRPTRALYSFTYKSRESKTTVEVCVCVQRSVSENVAQPYVRGMPEKRCDCSRPFLPCRVCLLTCIDSTELESHMLD